MNKNIKKSSWRAVSGALWVLQFISPMEKAVADASEKPKSCSSATGGSSNSLAYSSDGSYECAYTAGNSNNKIGAWATESWTSSTAMGYKKQYGCKGQSGGVSIKEYYYPSDVGSSITYTATNGEDGSRHWWSGVLWQTQENGGVASDQYIHDCNGNTGEIRLNKMYITTTGITSYPTSVAVGSTGSFNISVSAPYGNSPAQGQVYLYQQKDGSATNKANPQTDFIIGQGSLSNGVATITTNFSGKTADGSSSTQATAGNVLIYAAMATNPNVAAEPAPTPPQTGWVGSQSASYTVTLTSTTQTSAGTKAMMSGSVIGGTGVTLPESGSAQKTSAIPLMDNGIVVRNVLGDGYAPVSALCPKGYKPLYFQAKGENQIVSNDDVFIIRERGLFGAEVRLPAARANTDVGLQVVCRESNLGISQDEGLLRGTPRADRLTSDWVDEALFTGMGDDEVDLNHPGATALTGPDNDRVRLYADNTVADGSLGNDRIEVISGNNALIIGGSGHDTLIGGAGPTQINARDGMPGDKIVCKSPQNRVILDVGDITQGPCSVVVPEP